VGLGLVDERAAHPFAQRRFVDFFGLRLGPGLPRRNCSISDRLTSFLAPTTVVLSRPRLTSSEMDWRLTPRIRAASDCVTQVEGSIFFGILVYLDIVNLAASIPAEVPLRKSLEEPLMT
jgi:hypothetical protein